MSLTDKLRPHVPAIQRAVKAGDAAALQIITLYHMHRACPSDPGAYGCCEAAFDEWLHSRASQPTNTGNEDDR